jgi:hypothetical protein
MIPWEVSKTTIVSPSDRFKICKVLNFKLKRLDGVLTSFIRLKNGVSL